MDAGGQPVFALHPGSSASPYGTDESHCAWQVDLETVMGMLGGLVRMLVTAPGYVMVLDIDKGFK